MNSTDGTQSGAETAQALRQLSLEQHDRRVKLWSLTGALALAVGVAASSLGAVLTEGAWWFPFMAVIIVMLAAGATVRTFLPVTFLGSGVAATAGAVVLMWMFAGDRALLGFVPTGPAIQRLSQLVEQGNESIATQRLPADADTPIVFLLCIGACAIGLAVDIAAFSLRKPSLVGIPLVVLLLVPSFIRSELHDAFVFASTTMAYLGVLLVAAGRRNIRSVWPLIASTLAIALTVPVLLPSIEPSAGSGDRPGLISTGINPIISLSSDLRRNYPLLALKYTTEAEGDYLRVAVLDEFSDETWAPSQAEVPTDPAERSVREFPNPAGLSEVVPRTENTFEIDIERVRGKYLPVPYAASRILGLAGDWYWEPDGLTVSTEDSNSRDQTYTVHAIAPAPSIEQLQSAPTDLPQGYERYLQLPETLPEVVAETAQLVAGAEGTRFDQALALQRYFHDGDFVYSEQAPITEAYDGSGAAVLAEFLDAKSGYCVHFASAMAAMARSLEIPARVVVGFTPGEAKFDDDTDEVRYTVSTDDLHAWPELYFGDIGWIRFEPTVSVGSAPVFAQSIVDDPSTPDVDESQPEPAPTPEPSASSSAEPRPELPLDDAGAAPVATDQSSSLFALFLLVVPVALLIPAVVRGIRRMLRLAATRRGHVIAGWREIRDTATDLGYELRDTATPRQQYEDILQRLPASGLRSIELVLQMVEASAFSARPASLQPAAIADVLIALRGAVGRRDRLRARFAPRTAFKRD